jgi:hypothetical protein
MVRDLTVDGKGPRCGIATKKEGSFQLVEVRKAKKEATINSPSI